MNLNLRLPKSRYVSVALRACFWRHQLARNPWKHAALKQHTFNYVKSERVATNCWPTFFRLKYLIDMFYLGAVKGLLTFLVFQYFTCGTVFLPFTSCAFASAFRVPLSSSPFFLRGPSCSHAGFCLLKIRPVVINQKPTKNARISSQFEVGV